MTKLFFRGEPMKYLCTVLLTAVTTMAAVVDVQSGEKKKTEALTPPRKIVRLDPRFDKLLPKDAQVETIARGFIWTEGPAWNKEGGFLVFSDIPNNVVNK